MPTFRMLCLANSYKHGGRCIAGLRTDNLTWIRPISNSSDGTLSLQNYQLPNDLQPQLLDLLEIDCIAPIPQCHQPENWLIAESQWQLNLRLIHPLQSVSKKLLSDYLEQIVGQDSLIFGDDQPCIAYPTILANPVTSSLVLIKPQNLTFTVTEYDNKRKVRANFNLHQSFYSLPLTDPDLKEKLLNLAPGNYSFNRLSFIPSQVSNLFLTISLGVPFEQECYKLVAAVIYF